MGTRNKGGLIGGFDQLRAPDAPTISVSAGDASVTVTITNPSDVGGGSITGYAVSALTGPIEDTTYTITVVSGNPSNHPYYNQGSTNKFAVDGSTATADVTLTLYKGHTYIFDQSDSSNSGHPLRFSTTANGTHGGGSEYTTGVTTSGTPGSAGAFTKIALATDAPDTLYYYCTNHAGMGWQANNKTSLQGGASGSSSPITVSSLTNDETYNVRASAINAFGQSPYSASSSATPAQTFGFLLSQGTDIDKFNMASQSNSTDFADFGSTPAVSQPVAISNVTRMVGERGASADANRGKYLEYWSTSSGGSATTFGELSTARSAARGTNNSTRGIFSGGYTPSGFTGANVADYITIASTGNATNFGNLTRASYQACAGNSDTRSINSAGYTTGFAASEIIDYFTIASTGNATDFGDLTEARYECSTGHSNRTKSICAGGNNASNTQVNTMDFITISSLGNASDFGDLVVAKGNVFAGVASTTRWFGAVFFGQAKEIQTVQFASTGNSTGWADVTTFNNAYGGTSTAHGGIAS